MAADAIGAVEHGPMYRAGRIGKPDAQVRRGNAHETAREIQPDRTDGIPNILSKLGANDRTHAAVLGLKRGIIG